MISLICSNTSRDYSSPDVILAHCGKDPEQKLGVCLLNELSVWLWMADTSLGLVFSPEFIL